MAAGFYDMKFWIGVVVSREDGTNNGRVKVRVFGIHSDNEADIPIDALPWAPCVDGSYGSVNAVPGLGEWVFGAYLDGKEGQHPIVLGRIPGYHGQLERTSGLEGAGEPELMPSSVENLGRSPLHPAMIGEGADELSGPLLALAMQEDSKDSLGRNISPVSYKLPTRNLDNRVISGIDGQNYIVLASGEEGTTQITTASGATIQIDTDGNMLIQSAKSTSVVSENTRVDTVRQGGMATSVNGDWMLRVDNGNGRIYYQGDLDIECENFNLTVRGDYNLNVARTFNTRAADVKIMSYVNDVNIVANQYFKTQSVLPTTFHSETSMFFESRLNMESTAGWSRHKTLFGSHDITCLTSFNVTTLTNGMDFLSPIPINLNSLTAINIGAPVTYIDQFVVMATGTALGTAFPATPSLSAETLGIKAVGVEMADVPGTQPPVGYKASTFEPNPKPAKTDPGYEPPSIRI